MAHALRKNPPLRIAFSATPEEQAGLTAIHDAIARVQAEAATLHGTRTSQMPAASVRRHHRALCRRSARQH